MASSKLTPFERAACAWILRLPTTWTPLQFKELTASQEQGFKRLVHGGYIEAQLEISVQLGNPIGTIDTVWSVSGDYSELLEQLLRDFARGHRNVNKGFVVKCGQFVAARLTSEGELAKGDFHGDHEFEKPPGVTRGLPTGVLNIITGGPDGSLGNVAPGQARLLTESFNPPPKNERKPTADPEASGIASLVPELRNIAAAIQAISSAPQPTPSVQPPPLEPEAPSETKPEKWLSPGEQATLLLDRESRNSRDKTRRLQITGIVRKKALANGFLRESDLGEPYGRNNGVHVKKAAWNLPVAYYKSIRAAAGTDENAKNAFPAASPVTGKLWFFCKECIKTFAAEGESMPCPECKRVLSHRFMRRNT